LIANRQVYALRKAPDVRVLSRVFVQGIPDGTGCAQVPTRITPSATTPTAERQPVWKHGVAAAVVASVATTVLAALASAAGVSFVRSA